ncbi:hypothetical protein DRQ09_10390 [candidate division KSB1 bacterium]|nr:MAG: hypothetical protein DRQ09_10390 [candidate division KSB1 bacterium]
MKISSIDIRKQEFKKAMRGYDTTEVESFLELVADEFEIIQRVNSELKNKVKSLEAELERYKHIEKSLQSTLMEAKESSTLEKEKARKNGEFIIKEAEFRAMKIIEDAQQMSKKLKDEIAILKSQKNSLASRLKYLLRSQIDLIKILESDEMTIEEIERKKRKVSGADKEKIIQKKQEAEKIISEKEKERKKVEISSEKEVDKKVEKKIINGFNIIDKMILEKEKSEENKENESEDKK